MQSDSAGEERGERREERKGEERRGDERGGEERRREKREERGERRGREEIEGCPRCIATGSRKAEMCLHHHMQTGSPVEGSAVNGRNPAETVLEDLSKADLPRN